MPYGLLADAVLAVHFGVVVFVVGGLLAIPLGNRLRWAWVNGWAFRGAHAGAIVFITAQAWLGRHCPLTDLEQALRERAGGAGAYGESFIQHWLERLLYLQAPLWVFAVAYSVFAAVVAWAWWCYPPAGLGRSNSARQAAAGGDP